MNGGYVIVKEDLLNKISPGTYNYNGAFDYAEELLKTGKVAFVKATDDGISLTVAVNMIHADGTTIMWILTADPTVIVTFTKGNPNQFTITNAGG